MRAIAPRTLALLLVVSSFAVRPAHATEPFAKVGPTYGGWWLQLPVGIRNIGMGATGTADVSGFATGYFNPASVAWSDATSLTGTYENFDESVLGLNLSDFQVTSPFPFHADSTTGAWSFAGALAYTRQGMDSQSQRTIFLPEGTARMIDLDDWMLTALASSRWDHGVLSLAGGASAKYLVQAMAGNDNDIWMLDLGVIAAFPLPVRGGLIRPRVGYAALNLDNGGSFGDVEIKVANEQRVGLGIDLATPRVSVFGRPVPGVSLSTDYDAIDREHGAFQAVPQYSVGVEFSVVNMIHLRYGLLDHDYINSGVGIGWDYGRALFRLDYAHTDPDDQHPTNISLERDTFGALVGVRW